MGSFKVHGKELIYAHRSLNVFPNTNMFRKAIVWITEWKIFDNVVVAFIIIGSACQVLQDFSDPHGLTDKNKILFLIMEIITYFFIFEASMKIIAQGLIYHKNAYLRNNWNLVDFMVVISSIVEIFVSFFFGNDVPSFKMLRALRVFRPLRTFKRVPSMRRLVSIMLRSIPDLGNTIAFMVFFFVVFGIIGIQTFNGRIYQRCRLTKLPANGTWAIDPAQKDFICSDSYEPTKCRPGTFCGSPLTYPLELSAELDNPWYDPIIYYNTNNYNNLLNTIVLIFETLTLEGWSKQLKNLVDAGQTILAPSFFLIIIAFGSYFMINLILAVIMGSFSKFEQREIEERIKQAENQELLNSSKKTNTGKLAGQEDQKELSYHRQIVKDKMNNIMKMKPINSFKKDSLQQKARNRLNIDQKFDISQNRESKSIRSLLLILDNTISIW